MLAKKTRLVRFQKSWFSSKILRYRAPLLRAHSGATANISGLPHDDELIDKYDEDVESLYSNSNDDYMEQDELYKEEAPQRAAAASFLYSLVFSC